MKIDKFEPRHLKNVNIYLSDKLDIIYNKLSLWRKIKMAIIKFFRS